MITGGRYQGRLVSMGQRRSWRALDVEQFRAESQAVEESELGSVVLGHGTVITRVRALQLLKCRHFFVRTIDQAAHSPRLGSMPIEIRIDGSNATEGVPKVGLEPTLP